MRDRHPVEVFPRGDEGRIQCDRSFERHLRFSELVSMDRANVKQPIPVHHPGRPVIRIPLDRLAPPIERHRIGVGHPRFEHQAVPLRQQVPMRADRRQGRLIDVLEVPLARIGVAPQGEPERSVGVHGPSIGARGIIPAVLQAGAFAFQKRLQRGQGSSRDGREARSRRDASAPHFA